MRKIRSISGMFMLAAALVVTGCVPIDGSSDSSGSTPPVEEKVSQGVTATKVKVGNAATTSGGFQVVGIPFNAAIKARFARENKTKVDGRTIEFVTYDDGGLAAQGQQMIERLVEDDEVFSIVGHFGTWTVGQTLPYLQSRGVPMVYAATGINQLFFDKTPGNPIFAVQPIYRTEGKMLVARALKEVELFGTVDKLGVIYTTDDAGYSIKVGVDDQLKAMSKAADFSVYHGVAVGGDYAAAATDLKAKGVKTIIIAANQAPFAAIGTAIAAVADANYKPSILTSYVSAAVGSIPELIVNAGINVYTNAWVDLESTAGIAGAQELNADLLAAKNEGIITEAVEFAFAMNPALYAFAVAGYVAADIFITGLERVAEAEKVLNWKNYIAALEEAPIEFPMGGPIDFSEGKRHGLDSLSLLKATHVDSVYTLVAARPLETLDIVMAK